MRQRSVSKSFLFALFFVLFGTAPCVLWGEGAFATMSEEVGNVFKSSSPAVVRVQSLDQIEPRAGTGFFIDENGTILTSAAVVGEDYKVSVEHDGNKAKALVLSRDSRSGVALLRIETGEKGTPFLEFGDSDQLKIASELISVAYPYNLPVSPGFGIVAGFDVQYLNRFFATTHLRANLIVSPGQVGGPLLNAQGKVVGMMIMAIDDGKACYALPANAAQKIIRDMIQYGKARHGWVGVGVVKDTHPSKSGSIVRVTHLFEKTPAKQSGIEPGDRVLKIGERNIHQPSDILNATFFSKIGEKLPVLVERESKPMTFEIKVIERPSSSRAVQPIPTPPALVKPADQKPIRLKAKME